MSVNQDDFLGEVADVVGLALADRGIEPAAAQHIGLAVADAVAAEFGGQMLYVSKNARRSNAERDEAILSQHEAGEHAYAIARQHDRSIHSVYRAIARAKARRDDRKPAR